MSNRYVSNTTIRDRTNAIISVIDSHLGQHVVTLGRNVAKVELTDMDLTGRLPGEVLVLIYRNVFREVERAGYRAMLHVQQNPARNFIYIIWQMKVGGAAYEKAQKYIAERCITNTKPISSQLDEIYKSLVEESEKATKKKETKKVPTKSDDSTPPQGRELTAIERDLSAAS